MSFKLFCNFFLFDEYHKSVVSFGDIGKKHNNGLKTLRCSTPDTTLISLLLQPSTITCCDRFDRTVSIWSTQNLQYPQNRAYTEFLNG